MLTPVYDRSDLILRAIDTLKEKLLEESIVVALVCLVFILSTAGESAGQALGRFQQQRRRRESLKSRNGRSLRF